MPRMIYGDSYGQIGQQELARDAARDHRFFNSLQARNVLAQMAQHQQQQEFANRFNLMQMLANQRQVGVANRASRENLMFQQRQAAINRAIQARQFAEELASREKVAGMRSPGVDRDYSEAQGAISEGLIPPENLPRLFPRLSPMQHGRLGEYYRALAAQEAAEVAPMESQSDAVANTLNEQLSAMRFAKGLEAAKEAAKAAKKGWNWLPGSHKTESQIDADLAATVKDLTEGRGRGSVELDPIVLADTVRNALRSPGVRDLVSWDAEREAFMPMPIPRRFQSRNAMRPAAARDPLLDMAEEAIRLGADPVKVRARLQAMAAQR